MPELVSPECGTLLANGDPVALTPNAVSLFAAAVIYRLASEPPSSCAAQLRAQFDYRISMRQAVSFLLKATKSEVEFLPWLFLKKTFASGAQESG
jgi:hypothetical protein